MKKSFFLFALLAMGANFWGTKWVSENADAISFIFMPNDRFIKDCAAFTDLPNSAYAPLNTNEVRCEFKDNSAINPTFFTVRAGEVTCTYSVTEDGVSFPNHTVLGF